MPDQAPIASAKRELATKIVAAYVRRNQIGADQIPTLISTVHQAIIGLGKPVREAAGTRTPAVPIRQSVERDYVICLECGWRGKMLRRHLSTSHGSGVQEYRNRWNLRPEHPLIAPGYSELRSTMARELGLGRPRRAARDALDSA
jgi:predicted transcriptional regulator